MTTTHAEFIGSIPDVYDACLGPLLFEFAADDLAARVARATERGPVLEIACGTGILTEALRRHLPPDIEILATDLNPAMLDFARTRRGRLSGVRYDVADALFLPFEDGSFDSVVCQFGVMFFPDLAAGLAEIRRVLRPGGFVACNTWDSLEANTVAGIAHDTIAGYFAYDAPTFLEVPFGSCPIDTTLEAFRAAGFEEMSADVVEETVERPWAVEVARGFVEGNPGVLEIRERAMAEVGTIVAELAGRLERAFGPAPLRIPLRELVFTGRAPE
jgi:ubiquinone/menaquinone biosynthesis C-methylase UbiE